MKSLLYFSGVCATFKMLCETGWTLMCSEPESVETDGGGLTARPVNPGSPLRKQSGDSWKPLIFSRGCCILEIRARKMQAAAVNAPDKRRGAIY